MCYNCRETTQANGMRSVPMTEQPKIRRCSCFCGYSAQAAVAPRGQCCTPCGSPGCVQGLLAHCLQESERGGEADSKPRHPSGACLCPREKWSGNRSACLFSVSRSGNFFLRPKTYTGKEGALYKVACEPGQPGSSICAPRW